MILNVVKCNVSISDLAVAAEKINHEENEDAVAVAVGVETGIEGVEKAEVLKGNVIRQVPAHPIT